MKSGVNTNVRIFNIQFTTLMISETAWLIRKRRRKKTMGWIISIALLIAYFFVPESTTLLIASGLFGIAGAIAELAAKVRKN